MEALQPKRRAFTLIELLIVLGVVALLASLSFAGLAVAGDTTTLAVCRNNLRQVTSALQMYASDTDYYPSVLSEPDWIGALLSSLGLDRLVIQRLNSGSNLALSNSVFSCPGFNRVAVYNEDWRGPLAQMNRVRQRDDASAAPL